MASSKKLIVVRHKSAGDLFPVPSMYRAGGDDLGASSIHAISSLLPSPDPAEKGLPRRKELSCAYRPFVKSTLGESPDSGGRWFGDPTRPVSSVGDHRAEFAMHGEPPTHMSSNAMRWVHTFLTNHDRDFPGKLISPKEIIKKANDARLFPRSEIQTVLGHHGLDENTPVHPKDFLERIDERKSEFNPDHGIHLQVRQIPYKTTNLPNAYNQITNDFEPYTEHDHLRQPDNTGRLKSTYSPGSYRVNLLWAPHEGPDEGHWPYASHGTYNRKDNRHEAVAHGRASTQIDPKTEDKYYSVHETQSDALQQGRGQREYVRDAEGKKVLGHFDAPELRTKPIETAIGDSSDWHKPMLNAMIAHALQTGHDGIEIGSPAVMNGAWVSPEHRQAAMHSHYRLKQPEHIERIARQFGADVEYSPYYLDFNQPDSLPAMAPWTDEEAEQLRKSPKFRNTLRLLQAKQQLPEIDPENVFGVNPTQLPEAMFDDPAPTHQRGPMYSVDLASQARKHGILNEDGNPMRTSDLVDVRDFIPGIHHLYHVDSRKYRMPDLPPVSEIQNLSESDRNKIDPELLFLAEKNPQAYESVRQGPKDKPVVVKARLKFNDAMREHHANQGFGLWGVSGPQMNKDIERTAIAKRIPVAKKVSEPGAPTKDEWAALREEQRRSGVAVNDLLQSGWLTRYRAENA